MEKVWLLVETNDKSEVFSIRVYGSKLSALEAYYGYMSNVDNVDYRNWKRILVIAEQEIIK